MYEYDFAVYFWSIVVAAGLLAPFVWLVIREAASAVRHLHEHADPPSFPSLPSVPRPSRPSGY